MTYQTIPSFSPGYCSDSPQYDTTTTILSFYSSVQCREFKNSPDGYFTYLVLARPAYIHPANYLKIHLPIYPPSSPSILLQKYDTQMLL